ncbi:MAG: pyridoxal phosphate-dependent aminotransferase [Gammaproteobacteria bacterium]|nr:pyridoxal phosphate-dependent aminotransferase [Gammaproteobacteria bacterium]
MLMQFPPMGVYETLFRFADATNKYMGDPGTHPWAQGYPLTTRIPGGPPLPAEVKLQSTDLKYPKATGEIELRQAIADYYNSHYQAGITAENVCVFAGGRPGILATLAFLMPDICIAIEETEYTPYYDMLEILRRKVHLIPSNAGNRFRPSDGDYDVDPVGDCERVFLVKSNPCNPTGVATTGDALKTLVGKYCQSGRGALFDEAYEFYCDPEPESVLRHVDDIDATDIFVVGAATKGLQVPGMRVGWVIAAERHIEIFRNYSSFGMGGVSRPSQLYVTQLFEPQRVAQARTAVSGFFTSQRKRYREGLESHGFELFTGNGGFYHWGRLPGGISADEFNERLFEHEAGILPGVLCDMLRRKGDDGPLRDFARFSFGPLGPDSYESDMEIIGKCL